MVVYLVTKDTFPAAIESSKYKETESETVLYTKTGKNQRYVTRESAKNSFFHF